MFIYHFFSPLTIEAAYTHLPLFPSRYLINFLRRVYKLVKSVTCTPLKIIIVITPLKIIIVVVILLAFSTNSITLKNLTDMFSLYLVIFHLASLATACDRCVHQGKVAFFSDDHALKSGACGYGSVAVGLNDGRLTAAAPAVYNQGVGCGACFQMRCTNGSICSKEGTVVLVSDKNGDNGTDFVVSTKAFSSMAKKGKERVIFKLGVLPVRYKRVPCDYAKNKNLSIRVQEISQKPNFLAISFLYQGGQTEIVALDVAQVGSPNWNFMSRNYGAVWDTSRVPAGPLQFRFEVTSGFDGKWYWAKNVLPADWKNGAIYDSGLQIYDTAKQGCSPCDHSTWK